jgi:hypothetical protein
MYKLLSRSSRDRGSNVKVDVVAKASTFGYEEHVLIRKRASQKSTGYRVHGYSLEYERAWKPSKPHQQTVPMPPLRRYLRITKYTVLEVRIHLSQPSQSGWLLRGADPALARVIAAIRPLILPKLRDENEKANGPKSVAKKKRVKDVVKQGKEVSNISKTKADYSRRF